MTALMTSRRFGALFLYLFYCSNCVCQNKSYKIESDSLLQLIDSLKNASPSIELSTDFSSKVVFWGRDFGRKQYGFENNLVWKTGKGLYFNYTGYVWSASPNIYAKTDLGLGYEKQLTDNLYISVGYERWFFNTSNSYVKKALANFIETDINYDFGPVNIEPDLYYMFGVEQILQTDLNVNGTFFLCNCFRNGSLILKPQWLSTFANQAFLPIYSDYPSGYVKEKKFKLVDFEFSVPVALKIKNIDIEPDFHYNIPVKINNEQIRPFFYFSLHLAYNFYFDKASINKIYKLLK